MLKTIVKYIGTGFLYGIGFSIAVVIMLLVTEKIESTSHGGAYQPNENQTKYLKSLINSIETNGTDQCEDIVGTWVGELIEDDGAYIRSWELNYEEDGRFWGAIARKSITENSVEKQEGTWSCEHSVLFTDVTVGEKQYKWNYLLLHNADGERVYAHIGSYAIENIYRTYRTYRKK
ncbi:hypothetical protein [Gynuella sunshinyii]|uniref:Uncharacterized protein n=1 Tax=Gynuella sunshinyii YC6258 TaxID=1445510 RepID=A0A0C5V5S3_9GAMM|nr:hypothetical protein [Gynuella sunshinyii]AJQ94775.1 hypothetical Protein YC6258_02737 [Gynuella sunshinyii YC6258]